MSSPYVRRVVPAVGGEDGSRSVGTNAYRREVAEGGQAPHPVLSREWLDSF